MRPTCLVHLGSFREMATNLVKYQCPDSMEGGWETGKLKAVLEMASLQGLEAKKGARPGVEGLGLWDVEEVSLRRSGSGTCG